MSQARSLIFQNLPHELECIILNYYHDIRRRVWREAMRIFSTKKLVTELHKRCTDLDHSDDAHPESRPNAYRREMFRLYGSAVMGSSSTWDKYDTIMQNLDGHAMVNMGFALNDHIPHRVVSIAYTGIADIITCMNDFMAYRLETAQDSYDEDLIAHWSRASFEKKTRLISDHFGDIKDDYIKNYGFVNTHDHGIAIKESTYRVLRFSLINDIDHARFNTKTV